MKPINIRSEQNNNNSNPENNASNSAWTSASRLQNLAEKIEEAKWTDTQTPNPKKAPLNYIDNMWEWEEAQKKYVEEVAQKQQELMTILWTYEDKTEETDRFRVAKSELEIRLNKTMWIIVDKLQNYEDFLIQVYTKIYNSEVEKNKTPESEETDNKKENTENLNENVEEKEEKEEIKEECAETSDNEESEEKIWEEEWDEEWDEELGEGSGNKSLFDLLTELWLEFKVIPAEMMNNNSWKWKLLDNANEETTRFLSVMYPKNREKYKKLLDKSEIQWMENLYESIKKHCNTYLELKCQIDLTSAKIDKLENEESVLYSSYYTKVKEAKKMEEDMEKLNETYFLNSYLSTKSAPLENFISNPLVEKQISSIIELNKQGKPIPKTVLLCWSLNSWKSYAANVLATELWRKMYHIKSYDIFTWWFSDPNAMLDAIFTGAIKKKEPCIIFLDEIESYTQWYDGSAYERLLENTIRHHVSKIRESSLDIIVIWAVSDMKRVSPDLFKQDVFSQQIFFTWINKERAEVLFNKIIEEKGAKLWYDVNIHKLFEKRLKNIYVDPEYIKKIIAFTIDFSKLNKSWDSDNIILTQKDFNDAIDYIEKNINASRLWYYLSMMPR